MIKYEIKISSNFKKQYKKIVKQGKDVSKLVQVIKILEYGQLLEAKYKDHNLFDNKYFRGCRECHIEPDWLLIYKYNNNELILYLVETGSHSELFDK